jgi:hypothetical protein
MSWFRQFIANNKQEKMWQELFQAKLMSLVSVFILPALVSQVQNLPKGLSLESDIHAGIH